MATVIRFARHGTKKRPFFRMVVQDSRAPRDGKFIEYIGSFRPTHGAGTFEVDRARLEYWMGTGAQLSVSVKNRLKATLLSWKSVEATGVTAPAAEPKAAKAPATPKEDKTPAAKKKTAAKKAEAKS